MEKFVLAFQAPTPEFFKYFPSFARYFQFSPDYFLFAEGEALCILLKPAQIAALTAAQE